jgi:hypothetical protein
MEDIMSDDLIGGYGDMVWVRDKDGKEYACSINALKGKIKTKEEMSEAQLAGCADLSTVIGNW